MTEFLVGAALYLAVGFPWIYGCRYFGWIKYDDATEITWLLAALLWPLVYGVFIYRIIKQ